MTVCSRRSFMKGTLAAGAGLAVGAGFPRILGFCRRNVFIGVAASIFICFAYFILQRIGLALGSGQFVPPALGAWLPNALFGVTGLWLTHRVK